MAKPKTSKVAKKKAAKKPAAKKPAAKKPAAKKPAAKKPAAKKKAVKKPAAKKPAAAKAAPPSARARGVTVEAYVAALPPAFRSIADKLVALVREVAPEAKVSIKWGQPVFELGGPVLWMKAHAKHFGLGFWRGAELPDPKRLLEGAGQRMRHIKLRDPNAIDEPGVRALIRAAAEANEAKGDPTRRA